MRAVVQRVSRASVAVDGETIGHIGQGLVVLLGVGHGDTSTEARRLAEKIAHLRIFADEQGKFNRSAREVGAAALVVSQFTLYADARKGRRPSFIEAAPPELAEPLVGEFIEALRSWGLVVGTGRFGAMMQVELVNDGPVTIVLDTAEL
ncbi:MAG: D-tyrosyl-tRNA(Tyr) deacylase [Chloroflexi bacterium]|nr:D-tyrosyl-tRNA(Tyr) deacylase [Chloroflexota bacterium]